ncbi:hypothetical protein [Streptomyces sp. FIT100]|uniref:hypothetical protein n=1 Tax=Streptomyces sp. FIT100 TaxID=2837956 RepID=UPI0037DA22D8
MSTLGAADGVAPGAVGDTGGEADADADGDAGSLGLASETLSAEAPGEVEDAELGARFFPEVPSSCTAWAEQPAARATASVVTSDLRKTDVRFIGAPRGRRVCQY